MDYTVCADNPYEPVHSNMQAGTWPVAITSPTTGQLVITNHRYCRCGNWDKGYQVFYQD
jgi:hypothetical protein